MTFIEVYEIYKKSTRFTRFTRCLRDVHDLQDLQDVWDYTWHVCNIPNTNNIIIGLVVKTCSTTSWKILSSVQVSGEKSVRSTRFTISTDMKHSIDMEYFRESLCTILTINQAIALQRFINFRYLVSLDLFQVLTDFFQRLIHSIEFFRDL